MVPCVILFFLGQRRDCIILNTKGTLPNNTIIEEKNISSHVINMMLPNDHSSHKDDVLQLPKAYSLHDKLPTTCQNHLSNL